MSNTKHHKFFNVRSPRHYWCLGAFVSMTAVFNFSAFFRFAHPGHLFSGATAVLMALFVFYWGWLCNKGEFMRIGDPGVKYSGYLVVSLFALGFVTEVLLSASRLFALL